MPRYLLDTSALLAHFRKEAGWEVVSAIFDDADAEVLVCSVTLAEFARRLAALGYATKLAREMAATYRLLMNEIVAVDESIALAAFDISARTPERLPLVDSFIAAAARAQGAVLVHRDSHLASIPAEILEQRVLR